MKKRLLSIFAMAIVALGMQAAVGDDLTSKYLTNADFSADTPTQNGICTYAKDMANNGTIFYGMQPVTGWVASNPTDNEPRTTEDATLDGRASGVFALGKQYLIDFTGADEDADVKLFLGGKDYLVPAEGEGNALGMVSVWGCKLQYTQEVTLPAGAYELVFNVYNAGGADAVSANFFGFEAGDVKYFAKETKWEVQTWSTMKVVFDLKQQTTGNISLGITGPAGGAAMPHLFVASVKILESSSADADKELAQQLKEQLIKLIEDAEGLFGIDLDSYQAVYDDENATAAQVQAAIDQLTADIKNAYVDFTDFFLSNAHFAQGSPLDNGVCTYAKDKDANGTPYAGMQPVAGWISSDGKVDVDGKAAGLFPVGGGETTWLGSKDQGYVPPTEKANGNTEGNVFGFVSCWTFNAYYSQEVTLDPGNYKITIPMYNSKGGTDNIDKNMCGFIAEDGTEYLATTKSFPVNQWKSEVIKFTLEEATSGKMCIGYKAANVGSAKQPHLFVDEFLLEFNGKEKVDPSVLALNGAIRTGEGLVFSEEPYEAALRDSLEEAVNEGNDVKNAGATNSDENVAAANKINTLIAKVRTSIAAYKNFNDFIEGILSETIDKYIEGDLEDFATELAEDKSTYVSAWEDGEYTADQINEIINGFNSRVTAAVKAAFDAKVAEGGSANLDITALFADKNLGYDNSNVDGWTMEGTGTFKSTDQVAEVWGANAMDFTVYQTLDSLPAGVYEIQAPGFYRVAANPDNYAAWSSESVDGFSYLFAGNNRTLLHNVMEFAAEAEDDNHTAQTDGGFVYNSKAAAHYAFTVAGEAMNTVTGVLPEVGDLKIGIKGVNLAGNAWTVWEGFTVIFKGTDGMEAALYEEVKALSEEATTLADALGGLVQGADDMLNNAIDGADDCSESSSIEDLKAAIKNLQDAIAYANESSKLVAELEETYNLYTELINIVESNDNSYVELISEVESAINDGYESNEQIVAFINSLKDGWAAFVQHDVLTAATEQDPADITAAILNSGFEGVLNDQNESTEKDGNGDYWTKTRTGGNDFGYQWGVYESYNTDKFDIHQTIKGLAAGYYKVTVQGFYRAGDNQGNANAFVGDSLTAFAYFYANDYEKKFNNQMENGTNGEKGCTVEGEAAITVGDNAEYYVPNNRATCNELFSIGLYMNEVVCKLAEGEDLTIGLKKADHVGGDWCPFDNFKLYYLGTSVSEEPVTAIETVDAQNNATVAIFDLAGRRVAKAVKGIYIINGKKVIK